ncbi:major facilitator superfamily domain-containing protein [Podospora australis]|uniref:Major facilitator superfamily domain-containing protein n=1 Tax=Podospora australis TaxID=1536484 RepID=A0AAN6X6V2_9PEZI|nr:major facilitator superfamily domain-containing protein [Podospora australis]
MTEDSKSSAGAASVDGTNLGPTTPGAEADVPQSSESGSGASATTGISSASSEKNPTNSQRSTDEPVIESGNHAKQRQAFGERPACFKNTLQEVAFVFMTTNACAMQTFFLGTSSIITASIGAELGMSQGEITWITASSSLTAGAFQLGLGQMADLLGRRMMFIVGMGGFSAFSLLVAFAQNPFWMNVVCGIIGIASSMVLPPAIGIMGAAYDRPSRRKNMAFSAFGAGNPLGFVFGSILSGIATMLFNWRASFILVAILWAVFTVLTIWTIPKVEAYPLDQPFRERLKTFLKTFDSVGTVLTIFGVGVLTAGITLGPTDGWGSGHIIAMLVLGVALLAVFVFWERVYPHPLMPAQIWQDRNFTFIILSCLPGSMSFNAANFWLSLFMQRVQRVSPLMIAVYLIPQAVAGLAYNVIAGSILHSVNNTLLLAMGAVAYIASNVLYSLMRPDSLYWAFIFPALILSVIGADFQFNVANMYVMQSMPSHQQALAGGIFQTIFRLGAAIALGSSTAVFESSAGSAAALADPMLPYKKAFQVSIGLSAVSFLFLPFVRLGTQGHNPVIEKTETSLLSAVPAVAGNQNTSVVGDEKRRDVVE